MEKYQIEPHCSPEGSDDFCLCDEQHATRWYVVRGATSFGWHPSRDAAEEAIFRLQRIDRFVWRDGDVEHH